MSVFVSCTIQEDLITNEGMSCPQHIFRGGWLGRPMVLGSFHCRGVLLLLQMVGQGSAVLAAGAGWVGYVLFILF